MNLFYDDFYLYLSSEFSIAESEQLVNGNLSILQFRTELALSDPTAFNTSSAESSNHLRLPFYQQYLENSKIDPIRYIRKFAQTVAVGYMAYRHIKKYGFCK